jgi:hypothetical protein
MKQFTAHCQTCNWTGRRSREGDGPKQEKTNHLKSHPEHKVRVMVSGEDAPAAPSHAKLNLKS